MRPDQEGKGNEQKRVATMKREEESIGNDDDPLIAYRYAHSDDTDCSTAKNGTTTQSEARKRELKIIWVDHTVWFAGIFLSDRSADHQSTNLAGTGANLVQLSVSQESSSRIVVYVAVST